MRLWLITLISAAVAAAEPSLFYSKSFPGSTPAYSEVLLTQAGAGLYREDPADEQPVKFQLSAADVKAMFELAEKLDHFKQPLESGLKVAKVGDKVFRWMDGTAKSEQKFNYTLNMDAQTLTTWFERITDTERSYLELERTARFDKLGVNQALLSIQGLVDKKRLVAGEQFLTLLDRVGKNASFINMARERANGLASAIRGAMTASGGKAEAQR